ncbi:MAG: hypothetical protein JSV35_00340 [Candidatus Bathyarchaeota archaeon]|nr:MAG: hypothetical protein JSV35_00340 [Candidatus Bathyarchaeota archaeon]
MSELLRNKKAVAPVLSNVLLTIVAVTAMSLAASATYVITENMHQTMGERLIFEDVWFTSNGISIYLRNVGKVPVTVSAVYLNFTTQTITPLNLEIDEHGWLDIEGNWTRGSLYHVAVITAKGTRIVEYQIAK